MFSPPPRSCSIYTRRRILPEAFLGMESTNWTWRICLKVATYPAMNRIDLFGGWGLAFFDYHERLGYLA